MSNLKTSESTRKQSEKKTVCVIGLGTVGLPTARALRSSGFKVTGYDTDPSKTKKVYDFDAFSDWSEVPCCEVYVVCVPTGTEDGRFDPSALVQTAKCLESKGIDERTLIAIESTVTPGSSRISLGACRAWACSCTRLIGPGRARPRAMG